MSADRGADESVGMRPSLRRRLGMVAAVVVMAVGMFGWWATARGYIPPLTGIDCAAVYVGDADYDTLVDELGFHQWCARDSLDETWF